MAATGSPVTKDGSPTAAKADTPAGAKKVSSIEAMKLTILDAFQKPTERSRKKLVYRRSETFKSVSMYFVCLCMWYKASTCPTKLRVPALLCVLSTSFQSVGSSKQACNFSITVISASIALLFVQCDARCLSSWHDEPHRSQRSYLRSVTAEQFFFAESRS